MVEGDESSTTKSTTSQAEQYVIKPGPYTLFASDNPGALITSVMFSGDNYNEWST